MIYVALIAIVLLAGGHAQELSNGVQVVIEEAGSYVVKVNGFNRSQVWMPKGLYNVTIREISLERGALKGLVIVFSNTSLSLNTYMYRGVTGYEVSLELLFPKAGGCEANKTFWHYLYVEALKPYLERSVEIEQGDSICKITVDTGRAPGYLHVSPGKWASITVTGWGYSIAIVYGVEPGEASGLPEEGTSWRVQPITSLPVSTSGDSYVIGVFNHSFNYFNYSIIIGLLLILALVMVVELVSGKGGH